MCRRQRSIVGSLVIDGVRGIAHIPHDMVGDLLALKDDGVDYSNVNKAISSEVLDAAEKVKSEIISGRVKILPTYKEALDAGLVPAGLGAIDD